MSFVYVTENDPTMIDLLKFQGKERRINIPQEISTNFYQFGSLLVEDVTGIAKPLCRDRNAGYRT